MNHVQNDYLRVFFELVLLPRLVLNDCHLADGQSLSQHPKNLWNGSEILCGILVRLAIISHERDDRNPISYNLWFMNPLFVLMGASYGVRSKEQKTVAPLPPPRKKQRKRSS